MSTKHFADDAIYLVINALQGAVRTNPSLAVDLEHKVLYSAVRQETPHVSLISGGGSGHEPAFAGFVGKDFLDAAVAGSIFASPSAQQIYQCISSLVDTRKGVLVIIMNYTGDCLHFGMAVEKAKAAGIQAEILVVGDDVGVGRSRNGRIGRRGIAGTVLVQKIAGACSAAGYDLNAISRIATEVSSNLVSVGASLAHVHVPGRVASTDGINSTDEIEIGMGIHNEEGFGRVKTDLSGLVRSMLTQLLDLNDADRAFVRIESTDSIVLLVNNLGGVSPLEFGAITEIVCLQLEADYGLRPKRVLSGTYMTSLNGLGFSISVLKLTHTGLERHASVLDFLDAPTGATGWPDAIPASSWESTVHSKVEVSDQIGDKAEESNLRIDLTTATRAMQAGLKSLIEAEPDVTRYDTLVGDGDCGEVLKRGAEAVLSSIKSSPLSDDAVQFVSRIARVVEANMDGTSGAIYAIFLSALSGALASTKPDQKTMVNVETWAECLPKALESLSRYTPAQPGDRTVIDTLHPFVETLAQTKDLQAAVAAGQKGMMKTQGMQASLGRSVYVGGENFKLCPDPGAYGLSEFLAGLLQGL